MLSVNKNIYSVGKMILGNFQLNLFYKNSARFLFKNPCKSGEVFEGGKCKLKKAPTPKHKEVAKKGRESVQKRVEVGGKAKNARQEMGVNVQKGAVATVKKTLTPTFRAALDSVRDQDRVNKAIVSLYMAIAAIRGIGIDIGIDYQRHLSVMWEESTFKHDQCSSAGAYGFFQLKKLAVKDVKTNPKYKSYAGRLKNYSMKDPTGNCVLGILYHDLYRNTDLFAKTNLSEQRELGHMIYNSGITNVRQLVTQIGATSFSGFKQKLQAEVDLQSMIRQDGDAFQINGTDFSFTVNGNVRTLSLRRIRELLEYTKRIGEIYNGKLIVEESAPDENITPTFIAPLDQV